MSIATKLWSEGDCTRGTDGHEYVADAWKRLFGTVMADHTPTAKFDHGDEIETHYGDISVWNIHGAYHKIERLA